MNRALLAIAIALAAASAGCLVDRGPLVPVDADRPGDDAFVAEGDADAEAPDAWSVFDADAAIDATLPPDVSVDPTDAWSQPDTGPDAPTCTPRCSDPMTLTGCAGGGIETAEPCQLGCGGAPPHCLQMVVSNLSSSTIFDLASSDLTVGGDTTIDTSRDVMVRTQRDGAEVAVLVYGRIDIGGTLRVVGPRPLILVARDAMFPPRRHRVAPPGGAA